MTYRSPKHYGRVVSTYIGHCSDLYWSRRGPILVAVVTYIASPIDLYMLGVYFHMLNLFLLSLIHVFVN